MEKNAFTTIGILAVLLLSLGMVSAAKFTFEGTSILPTTGAVEDTFEIGYLLSYDESTLDVTVDFSTNENHWSDLPSEVEEISEGDTVTGTTTLTIPSDYEEYIFSTTLKARIKENPFEEGDYANTFSFPISITIPANEKVPPTISASLDSEAKVGEELIIIASIKNNDDTGSFDVSVVDYDSWATLTSVTPQTISIDADATEDVIIKFTPTSEGTQTFKINADFSGESYDQLVSVIILPADTPTQTTSETLCESENYEEIGNLEISDFDVNNNGEGKDDEWQYLDEVEIIVEIENTHDIEDIEDVEVQIAIFDDKIENGGVDVTNDFEFDDEVLTNIGKLKDGDKEEVIFLIEELPSDLNDGTYYMYIMTYEDGNEEEQCESKSTRIEDEYYFQFTIESVEYDESIIAKEEMFGTSIDTHCGQQNLEISIPIYNLGDEEEEKVLVKIYNSEMGIDEFEVIDDLGDGDKKIATFFIDVPSELSNEKYDLDVSVYFDWDEDMDDENIFSYDEITSDMSVRLNILSCKGPSPTITPSLDSEAKVGEELVVIATVTNKGESNDFDISISGYESWAELVSVYPLSLSLDEDGEGTVAITLIPNKEGTQALNVDTIFDGESHSQKVSVIIEDKEKTLFADVNKAVLYSVAGVAILLALIFLTLIVKISRRSKEVPQF